MNIHLTASFHPSLSVEAYTQTKLRHADIDEQNRKLLSDNDTLRSQNSDLAKELVGDVYGGGKGVSANFLVFELVMIGNFTSQLTLTRNIS